MSSLAPDSHPSGFLTAWLTSLPRAISTLIGVLLLLAAFGILLGGARSLEIGTRLGREADAASDKAGWLDGGIGGLVFGGVTGGTISAAVLLLVLSYQDAPSLNRWATLAILLLPSVGIAIVGGRWRIAAILSPSFLGAVSSALLVTCSAQIATLLPRLILFFISFILLLACLYCSRTAPFALAIAAALTGAYLFVLAVDCFTRLGFVDAIGLLVSTQGVYVGLKPAGVEENVVKWTSARGKALIAGWWLLAGCSGAWQVWWGFCMGNDEVGKVYQRNADYNLATNFRTGLSLSRLKGALLGCLKRTSKRGTTAPTAFTELPRRRGYVPWDDHDLEVGSERTLSRPSSPYLKTATSWDGESEQRRTLEVQRESKLARHPPSRTGTADWRLGLMGNSDYYSYRDAQPLFSSSNSSFAQGDMRFDGKLDTDFDLDLPAFASQPAQYRPLRDERLQDRRPLSALASMDDSDRRTRARTNFSTFSSATGAFRAVVGQIAGSRRPRPAETRWSERPHADAATSDDRGVSTDQYQAGETAPVRRPSMEDWWAQVVQKSEEG
ncbi:hypothetical protein JCM10908_005030 [Rhodotorula pacifica]|uniref:uncharacterized protein n=1 Tax=Rhodotorula pacifica TaxID=1495444 RepID=UPI003175ADA7